MKLTLKVWILIHIDVSNIQFKLLDLDDKTKVLQVLNETSAYAD